MEKRKKNFVGGVFIVLVVSLIVSMAIARDTENKKHQDKDVAKCMMRQCKMITGAPIYFDSPAVILGRAETLKLSAEQKGLLKKIEDDARKKALGLLTPEQREKLGEIPAKPITLAQLCGKMPCGKSKNGTVVCPIAGKNARTCPADCTKPCCAVKPGVCPIGCTKPCCAVKSKSEVEQKTCPVMGGVINKNVSTEYEGKKVYFCCPGCIGKFEEKPEKYIAKLPQFKK